MSDEAPVPEVQAAVSAAHRNFVVLANELNATMEGHGVAQAVRARVLLSAIATTQASAIESFVARLDRHMIAAELSRCIHLSLMGGGAITARGEFHLNDEDE